MGLHRWQRTDLREDGAAAERLRARLAERVGLSGPSAALGELSETASRPRDPAPRAVRPVDPAQKDD
jgi:hypothetical protein